MSLTDAFILSVQQRHKKEGLSDFEHYFDMTAQLSTFCHSLEDTIGKDHANKMALIQKIINYTDNSADAMEGADMDAFVMSQERMIAGIEILELLGIKYDPMTGKREQV